jgi:hypothetical protein
MGRRSLAKTHSLDWNQRPEPRPISIVASGAGDYQGVDRIQSGSPQTPPCSIASATIQPPRGTTTAIEPRVIDNDRKCGNVSRLMTGQSLLYDSDIRVKGIEMIIWYVRKTWNGPTPGNLKPPHGRGHSDLFPPVWTLRTESVESRGPGRWCDIAAFKRPVP